MKEREVSFGLGKNFVELVVQIEEEESEADVEGFGTEPELEVLVGAGEFAEEVEVLECLVDSVEEEVQDVEL